MISDSERREVAARLRELPSDTCAALKEWEGGGLFIDASLSDEADYSQIHNAVLGCFPAEHMHPGDYEELHERLADLIDRPTCTMTYKPEWSSDEIYPTSAYQCSNCGCVVNEGITEYCPSCGYRVSNFEMEPER